MLLRLYRISSFFFFFNDTPTTEIYTLSLHDALPISARRVHRAGLFAPPAGGGRSDHGILDRKSTRLNSSHVKISYAVFCLKKKKITTQRALTTEYENAASGKNISAVQAGFLITNKSY